MKIAIFGLGLIGGSLGRAIIRKTKHEVYGYDIDKNAVTKAELLNAVSDEGDDAMLATCDLVVLALCPNTAIEVMKTIVPRLKSGTTVIDCCGNKRKIVEEMRKECDKFPDISFVGVHPMAGREFSGISHSTVGLFEHAYFIITNVKTPIDKLCVVRDLFYEIGCEGVVTATAETHDRIIAYTSQLAHIVSSAYIKSPTSREHVGFSAGSFRDMTRVAKLNPEMWTELFMDNRDNLINEIEGLQDRLNEYLIALKNADHEGLKNLLVDGVRAKEEAENARKYGGK